MQGGDIFNALEDDLASKQEGFISRLVFKRFARNQIQVLTEEPTDSASELGIAVLELASGQKQYLWLCETEISVTESYPFDEDMIVAKATIDGKSIQLNDWNTYSMIENIIALTKKLNYELSPDIEGKWLFGQLDLHEKLPKNCKTLRINRTICVANRFSRNRIIINNKAYGEIRFIGGEP